jgi:hypothetical protein
VLFTLERYRLQGLQNWQCHSLTLTIKHRITYVSVLVDVTVADDPCVVAGRENKVTGNRPASAIDRTVRNFASC